MKKYLFPLLCLVLTVLTGCKKAPVPDVPELILELPEGSVTLVIPAEGGVQSLPYSITGPVDGGSIEARPVETWINGFDYDTPGLIIFNADPNEVPEARSSLLTVIYTYGEGLTVTKDINVIQDPAPDYDYEWEMTEFTSDWYGDMYGNDGEHNYYTWISDKPFVDRHTQPGGTYYLFDLYAGAPENRSKPQIPAGTYTLGELEATAEWTFSPDYSTGVSFDEEGNTEFELTFEEGTLTVEYDENGNIVMDAVLTDMRGDLHHVTYSGEAVCDDESSTVSGIGYDLDFAPDLAGAVYISGNGTVMEVGLQFTDMEADESGTLLPPGTLLTMQVFMQYEEDGRIAPGTYTVSDSGEEGTFYPGINFFDMLIGTYAEHLPSDKEYALALVNGGIMEVTDNGDGTLTFDCDLDCADGYKLTCSWTGSLTVSGMPGPFSTLTGDYTLDLEGAEGEVGCYGDAYGTGGSNWFGTLSPTTGSDGLQFEIVSEMVDSASEGIPSGTYRVSATNILYPWEYLYGYTDGSYLYGTVYFGKSSGDGLPSQCAPATSGDLNITNHGDGTYTFVFAFQDDLGNTWSGDWTGEMTIFGQGQSMSPVRSSAGLSGQSGVSGMDRTGTIAELPFRTGGSPVSDNRIPACKAARKF